MIGYNHLMWDEKMDNHSMPEKHINSSTPSESPTKLQRWKDVATIVQAVAAVCAVFLAGVWFVVERNWEQKITVSHEVTNRQLNPEWRWVHVAITLFNAGSRVVEIQYASVVVQRILPLDPSIRKRLSDGTHLVWKDDTVVEWPRIGEPLTHKPNIKIEPGETDKLYYEFQIPTSIKTVQIQSHFMIDLHSGWTLITATIHDLF